jgi:hypothetical protein
MPVGQEATAAGVAAESASDDHDGLVAAGSVEAASWRRWLLDAGAVRAKSIRTGKTHIVAEGQL